MTTCGGKGEAQKLIPARWASQRNGSRQESISGAISPPLPCPALETGPPHTYTPERYSTIPHRQNSLPRKKTGRMSSPSVLSRRRCTHPPRVLNGGLTPLPEVKTSFPRMPPKGVTPFTASEKEALYPIPTPVRQPSTPGTPGMGGTTPAFQVGRFILPRAPGAASRGPGVGRYTPPRAPPSGTFRPRRSGSRSPFGARTGPLGPSAGVGGSIPATERDARSGTVTCRRAALRSPGRLRSHGPRLSALRFVRHLQLHGREHGPAADGRADRGCDPGCGYRC